MMNYQANILAAFKGETKMPQPTKRHATKAKLRKAVRMALLYQTAITGRSFGKKNRKLA